MPSDTRATLGRRAALALLAGILAGPALPALAQTAAPETTAPKTIGIIGGGNIGGTLAALWAKAGYTVIVSSRHPEDLKGLVETLGPNARAATPAEAITAADAVLVAVPYKAYPELGAAVAPALKGKVLIDAGNATKARDGALYDEVQANGIGPTSARYFPGARIVRAFNAANFKVFQKNANRPAPRMAIPIAGDDAAALDAAKRLVTDAGFDPVVVGPLQDASRFAMGSPGFGLDLPAPELRTALGVAP